MSRVELVLGLVLCAVSLGLLAPALARAGVAAKRAQSADNLRNLGVGFQSHHATFGFYPSNGGPPPEAVTTPDVRTGIPEMAPVRWGYGDPRRAGRLQTGSYAYALLPFVGAERAFRNQAHDVVVPAYYLTSRRDARAQPVPKADPIYANWTYIDAGLSPWGRTDYSANDQVVKPGMGQVMRRSEIVDGLSETILAGEKALDTRAVRAGGWYWDEPIILGGSGGTARKGKFLYPDADDLLDKVADNRGSPDPAGVHFLFADGHVRLLGYKTDAEVVWSLMTPAGDKDVDLPALR